MHGRLSLLLLVVVGGLVGLVWWQRGREESGELDPERAFLDGAIAGRIVRMHVDNLERGLQLTLERNEAGAWWIVDPIEYPAEVAVVDLVLEAVTSQTVFDVAETDLAGLSLAPPRVVLKLDEEIDGGRRTRRIEIGAVDLDRQHVFARVDGQVVRVLRTLDTALERDLPGWRSRLLFHDLAPNAVVELTRRGSAKLLEEEDPIPVGLRAVQDGGWRATEPWETRLDPARFGRLLQTVCWLRAATFVDDAPRDLAYYGLDPAPVTVELETIDGRREVLRLAPASHGEEWLAAVESMPHVYAVSYEDLVLLSVPVDLLIDRVVARFSRDGVGRFEFEGAGRKLMLERSGADWLLSVEGAGIALSRVRADADRVTDLLSELERARLLALLPDVPFEPRAEPAGLRIEFEGRFLGGELGAHHRTEDGGEGVLFRRFGDGLIYLVDASLLERATLAPDELRSRQLVDVAEIGLARIELTFGDQRRVFVRQDSGRWSREGTEVEATSFSVLVDRLLSIRAEQHLPGGVPVTPEEPLEVRIVPGKGDPLVYELGRRAATEGEPSEELFTSAEGQALVAVGLHEDLARLFGE